MNNQTMAAQIIRGDGFIAALDQSGGSTPSALRLYGIPETAYTSEAEMFTLMHEMRVRIMTSPSFTARGVQGDVANLADLDRLYEVVRDEAGQIDVLFANEGGGDFMPLGEITEEHFDRIFATNVRGTLFTVQKALPLLKDGASVILTGSTAAIQGNLAFSVYGASKAAIRSFARGWILDLAPRKIRVNVLAPGSTSTPGLHGLSLTEEQARAFVAAMEAATPLGRMADPDEIGNAALFLASDESSFVNGSELFVDGGSAQV